MRHPVGLVIWALCAVLPAALAAAPASEPSRTALAGHWEAVLDSPRRPWHFVTRFTRTGDGWRGALIITGLPEFPLADVRADSTRVRFRLPPELDALEFEGTLDGSTIAGQVSERGAPIAMRLARIEPLPRPANRIAAWRQDLDYVASHLSAYDRSFTPEAREEFLRAVTELKRALPRRSDAEIMVGLSRAVALAGNAHTRLRLDATRQGTFAIEFPLRLWSFPEGVFVVRAAPEYRRALRCRVLAIDGHPVSGALDSVARAFAGNEAWTAYLSPIYLTSPDVLRGLGVIRASAAAAFTLEDERGARFTLPIRARRVDRDAMPGESWQELSPLLATGRPPWTTALSADPGRLPLYLRHPEKAYWFEYRPETGMLYFQFNRSGEDERGPGFREFADSLLGFARRHPIRDVVIDLRFNSGGDLNVARAFVRGLEGEARVNRRGHLFAIVGRCTFSAGLYHAAQLRQFTHATFVGEPVGDRLDYWAEGGHLALPNSGAVIAYSNGFHRYSGRELPGHPPCYEALSVPDLSPDLPAPLTWSDYLAGRDPALAAVDALVRP